MAALDALFSLKRNIEVLIDCYDLMVERSKVEDLQAAIKDLQAVILSTVGPSEVEDSVEDLEAVILSTVGPIKRRELNALDGRIAETARHLEDVIESSVSYRDFSSQLLIDFEKVKKEIVSFTEMARKMTKEYFKVINFKEEEEEEEEENDYGAILSYSSIDFGTGKKPIHMVGFSDQLKKIKDDILRPLKLFNESIFTWFVGSRGSGRTILARSIFDDLCNDPDQHFDHMAWVTGDPNPQLKSLILSILAHIDDRQVTDKSLMWEGDGELTGYLRKRLSGNKYCIVLDDVPKIFISDFRRLFPLEDNGSLVLVTANIEIFSEFRNDVYVMPVLSTEECWGIIREKVFAQEPYPPELEKPGKIIAQNCKGLALAIIKVAVFLSKAEKTPEYWNKLAEDKQNSIFVTAKDEISEVNKIKDDPQFWKCFFGDGDHGNCSPRIDSICIISAVLGSSYGIERIKRNFIRDGKFPGLKVVALSGMAGIGKTTLAKEIFKDPSILLGFNHRIWVTLGPKYRPNKIVTDVLSQIYPNITENCIKGDYTFAKNLQLKLFSKASFIVLDDVWNTKVLDYLPKYIKGSILVTTTMVGPYNYVNVNHKMDLLDKEESWHLLHDMVFVEESCPHELEKVGRKIAEKCDGLPLLIATVADFLSKAERTPTNWRAREKLVFTNAFDKISENLFPRYDYLDQFSKFCFLYIGVFPEKYEVSASTLFNLWRSEGCTKRLYDSVGGILEEIGGKSLVMIRQHTTAGRIKRCCFHSVFWYLSNREARKNKFFHALNNHGDRLLDDLQSVRRLSIRNGILFCIKDVRDSIASASNALSLLCTGPPHPYPVPIYLGLKMLRVLDALTIRFYDFPIKVLELIQLRYLAFTYNGKIPSSISKLRELEVLIIHQHQIIRSHEIPCYLPVEIWDMSELKHLQIMGNSLPIFDRGVLFKIRTLLDVSAQSCTEAFHWKIPKLQKLGIRIEFVSEAAQRFKSFDHVRHLRYLTSLKCVIVNPDFTVDTHVAPPAFFPISLKKLTLSGFGYPWEFMRIIGQLENLQVLKLRCYAFRGPEWETYRGEFKRLEYLLLEDTDLVYWKAEYVCFPRLKSLLLRHCYKLKEIPLNLPAYCTVDLIDCNPELENKWKRVGM